MSDNHKDSRYTGTDCGRVGMVGTVGSHIAVGLKRTIGFYLFTGMPSPPCLHGFPRSTQAYMVVEAVFIKSSNIHLFITWRNQLPTVAMDAYANTTR